LVEKVFESRSPRKREVKRDKVVDIGPLSIQAIPEHFRGATVARDLDLLQGTLDLLVLKALSWGPRHGYAVALWLRQRTDQTLTIEEGALYTALHRMEQRGWISAEWGLSDTNRKAKFYSLTAQGRRQLRALSDRWATYARMVFRVLRTA
jgi:PadR family transcriptional regulator PadR